MGSTSSALFTGSSAFSAQLQQVITQAVSRASAPLTQLDNQQTTLQGQQTELQTLTSDFSSLQSAITALNSAVQNNGLAAQVDNSSVASATATGSALAGTYSLNVISLGSQANMLSADGLTTVTDPSSTSFDTSSSYTLTDEGKTYTITPTGNTLDDLVQAINNSEANVQATVVNVGSSATPDYRLSIQSNDYAAAGIQLSDGTNNSLLQTIAPGANVEYQVNGEPAQSYISATSRQATLSPGLTVTMLGTGTANISVAASTSAVSNAISNLAAVYNQASADLQKNRGQNGGALAGQSIVYELQGALDSIANYTTASGSVNSLGMLGLSFDSSGNLQFDSTVLSGDDSQQVLQFLGNATSSGFLEQATTVLNGVTDSTTGILATDTQSVTSQLSSLGTQITDEQTSITNLQSTLTQQMSQADAAISSLEQQVSEMTDLFATEQANEIASANGG